MESTNQSFNFEAVILVNKVFNGGLPDSSLARVFLQRKKYIQTIRP